MENNKNALSERDGEEDKCDLMIKSDYYNNSIM